MNYGVDKAFLNLNLINYNFENFYKEYKKRSNIARTEYCLQYIISKLQKSSISALVGAGFSLNANLSKNKIEERYKDWAGILVNAYKNLYPDSEILKKGTPDEQYDEIKEIIYKIGESNFSIKYVKKHGNRESLDLYIENEFDKINKKTDNLVLHTKLLRLNWCDILTTNWDTLLERASLGANKNDVINPVLSAKGLKIANRARIVKLNGSLRTEKQRQQAYYCFDNTDDYLYVITPDDFENYREKHEGFSNFMKIKTLENSLCLFGFSGHDINFKYWIKELKSTMKKGGETEDPNPIFLFAPPEKKNHYKNPQEKENAKIDEISEAQFLKNNYIIKIPLEDVDEYFKAKCKNSSVYKEIPENADYLQKTFLMFENLFDYLNEKTTKENEELLINSKNDSAKIIRKIAYSDNVINEEEMCLYNTTQLFDYQNLTYSSELVEKLQGLQTIITEWSKNTFCFVYRCCLNHYFSLQNLYKADIIEKIISHYESHILSKKQAPEFIELILKYYKDSGQSDKFDALIEKYKNLEIVQDYINYQIAYSYYVGFEYKKLKDFLQTWEPDKNNKLHPMFMVRKASLMMEYDNVRYLSSKIAKDIARCYESALEKCEKELQLKYFILLSYKQFAIEQDVCDIEFLDMQIQQIENITVFPRLYFDYFLRNNKEDTIKPNSDTRYTVGVSVFKIDGPNNSVIRLMRLMNFVDYTGINPLGLLKRDELLLISNKERGFEYHSVKTLIKSIRYFGYSSGEEYLRAIVPRILRNLNIKLISALMEQIYEIFLFKINENEDATIYFYLLAEFSKKSSDEIKRKIIIKLFDLLKKEICINSNSTRILTPIERGSIWGWKIPFEYFLNEFTYYIEDDNETSIVIKWILDNYLLEEKNKSNPYFTSEFKQYFIHFVFENKMNERVEKIIKKENIQQFLSCNKKEVNAIALYVFDYLTKERQKELVKYYEKNYELNIDPYFITVLNSEILNNRVIGLLDNYDILNMKPIRYFFFQYVKNLCKSKVITDLDLTKIIIIIEKKYKNLKENSYKLNNHLYKERIESLFISVSEVKFVMNENEFRNSELFEELKKEYIQSNNDFFMFRWLYDSNLEEFKKYFIQAFTIFSYLEEEKKYLYVFNIGLAKILVQDSAEFEAVLEQFLKVYESGYGYNVFDNENTKTILREIYLKFNYEIPECYDELFIKKQMKRMRIILNI